MALLSPAEIRSLYEAAVDAGLHTRRDALLVGIPRPIVAGIPHATAPGDQILQDIDHLNRLGVLADGDCPLLTWLQNAMMLVPNASRAHAVFAGVAGKLLRNSTHLYWYAEKHSADQWIVSFSRAISGPLRFAQKLANGLVDSAAVWQVSKGVAIIPIRESAVDVLVSQEAVQIERATLRLRRALGPFDPASAKPRDK